jgi:predicted small secreted protein
MATATMLRPCNTQERVHKSGVKRLTMHSVLFSLRSRVAVLRRWDGRIFSGAVTAPVSGAWQRMRSAIRWQLAEKSLASHEGRQGTMALLALSLAASLAGCASMSGGGKDLAPEAKQALVTERINARWNALIKGDLDQAYTFMSAGSQEAMPLKLYKEKIKPGMWRAVKVDSMNCDAEICQVKMTLTYDHKMMKGVQTPFEETWILEKGNAWYVYRDRE